MPFCLPLLLLHALRIQSILTKKPFKMSNFNFRRLSFLLLSILGIMPVVADDNNKVDLTPELHGVIRPRWEMDTKGVKTAFRRATPV